MPDHRPAPFAGDWRPPGMLAPLLFIRAVRNRAPNYPNPNVSYLYSDLPQLLVYTCVMPANFGFAKNIWCAHAHPYPMLGPPLFSTVALMNRTMKKKRQSCAVCLCLAYKGVSIHPVCCLETVSLPTIMSSSPIPAHALRLHCHLLVPEALRRCDVSSLVGQAIPRCHDS